GAWRPPEGGAWLTARHDPQPRRKSTSGGTGQRHKVCPKGMWLTVGGDDRACETAQVGPVLLAVATRPRPSLSPPLAFPPRQRYRAVFRRTTSASVVPR